MKSLLTWVLLLGLLVGVRGNVGATDPCEGLLAMHAKEHAGHHHDPGKPCDPSHDQNCPLGHHQQCACCHAMPMGDLETPDSQLATPNSSLMAVRRESQQAPEGPYAELDKPPLI